MARARKSTTATLELPAGEDLDAPGEYGDNDDE